MKEKVEFVDRRGTDCLKWDMLQEKYGDKNLLSMWVADMDFRCPACVNDAIKAYADHGVYGYNMLMRRYFAAFTRWEEERHGYRVERDWLRFSPGVVPAVNWCVYSMTRPGDAVMVLSPVYYPFFHAVEDNGRKLVESRLLCQNGRYEMDLADMEEKMRSNQVRLLIFCSPHNPVGRVWQRQELEQVAALCDKYGVILLSDEIHQDFVYGEAKHIPVGLLRQKNTVMLTAPSKTFNLAGLASSVVMIPDEALRKKWDTFTGALHLGSGNIPGYLAGEAAYTHGADWLEQVKEIVYGNYRYLKDALLERLPLLQVAELEGTYLMWVDFGAYLKAEEMTDFFEKKCRLALDYGDWFRGGADTCVRFNLATSREIVEQAAMAILKAFE